MTRVKKYFINALILSACTLLMRTVAVAFNAFCVNKVGSEGMGLFSLVMSVYTFAVTLATSGVNLAATRLVALYFGKNEGAGVKSAMRGCFLYSTLFGTLSSALLFLFSNFAAVNFLNEPRAAMSIRALSLSLLPLSLCSAFSGYFAAVRRVYKNAISQVLEQAVKILSCTFLLSLLLPRGIEYACLALVLGGTVSEIFSFLIQIISYLSDTRTLNRNGKKVAMRDILHISLPVAFSAYVRSGLVTVEHILIPIGLTAFGDSAALATYGIVSAVALPIVLYPSSFVGAFSGQIIPEITEFYSSENKKEIAYVTERAFFITLFFSILVAGMFCAFAGDICEVIYNSREAAEYLRALAPLMPVMFLDTVTDSILKGLGKQFYTMCVNIADAAISVLLVWLLVPRVGVYGYIAVIFISECVNTVFSIGKLMTMIDFKISTRKILICPLASAVFAANFVRMIMEKAAFPMCWGTLIFECLMYITVYFTLTRLFGAVGKEEIAWAKKIAKNS
ncbi:MAG: polysaccharide biosynthesis protein [Ruminococcaceae bacterium]|nr:polysaccharide biosynthesis protein [Oscillospiraceae bacterium]MBE6966613.1 polysaccharide biosynthesis protein [Oscillospiraceae bacterium]